MGIYDPQVLTERTITNFKPTRLAIKELAGQLYFCKSIVEDIESYPGSGVRWKKRIKKYGKENIKTLWVSDWYQCPHEIQEVALHFSMENLIVEAEKWANIKPENGLDGGMDKETAKRISSSASSKKNKSIAQNRPDVKLRLREKIGDFWKVPENRDKMIAAQAAAKSKHLESHRSEEYRLANSGKNSPHYDHTVYSFIHSSGKIEITTRGEFIKKYSLHASGVCKIINTLGKSHLGWRVNDSP